MLNLKLKLNTFFLTVNTALVTAIGIGLSSPRIVSLPVWHTLLPLAGILVSIIWWGATYSYKQRNIIKLRVIHCLEERLPLALYKTEWALMEENHSSRLKKFLFSIDLFIPFVFLVCYLLFVFFIKTKGSFLCGILLLEHRVGADISINKSREITCSTNSWRDAIGRYGAL